VRCPVSSSTKNASFTLAPHHHHHHRSIEVVK
jgi:hypothetical protein